MNELNNLLNELDNLLTRLRNVCHTLDNSAAGEVDSGACSAPKPTWVDGPSRLAVKVRPLTTIQDAIQRDRTIGHTAACAHNWVLYHTDAPVPSTVYCERCGQLDGPVRDRTIAEISQAMADERFNKDFK